MELLDEHLRMQEVILPDPFARLLEGDIRLLFFRHGWEASYSDKTFEVQANEILFTKMFQISLDLHPRGIQHLALWIIPDQDDEEIAISYQLLDFLVSLPLVLQFFFQLDVKDESTKMLNLGCHVLFLVKKRKMKLTP